MGVTIHFEGKLRSEKSLHDLVETAKDFAQENDLPFSIFQEENKLLERVKDEKPWDYQGPTKGIIIQPAQNCDPVNLEFDSRFHLQEFCKTQFADISIHVLVVSLLRQIESYFEILQVEDEGEFWNTNDEEILSNHLSACFRAIEDAKSKDKSLSGPYKLADRRIVDLMSDKG